MIGTIILHYNILEELGRGGMGEVYKAQDTKLDRYVALKFLPSQLTASEEDKARFIQEAKAASAMNHPNVCTIHDIQEYNDQLFIVMEYVDGKTLKDKKDSLSEKQILEIGIQTAEGLAAAHEKGIVHRDIKPENIMVRKDGIVQIMDFGLAKLYTSGNVSRLTKAGTTMGTMGYMSPEQVQGLDVDHRTDIFSLGVVLYEMLAGESPFKGVHETAIMYEIVNVDPPPISTVKEGIDPQIDEIILECLEKDKDERCQSAKELAKDLRKVKKSTGHSKSRVYSTFKSSSNNQTIQTGTKKSSGSIAIEVFERRFELQKLFPYLFVIVTILAAVFAYLYLSMDRGTDNSTIQFKLYPPDGSKFTNSGPKISPDGKTIAFTVTDSTGKSMIWLRAIGSVEAKPLEGTENAAYPFWSYDGKYLGFFADKKMQKINPASGSRQVICDAKEGYGAIWGKDNQILFMPSFFSSIYKINAGGGTPVQFTKLDNALGEEHHLPIQFLPDNKHFIYTAISRNEGRSHVFIGSVDDNSRKSIYPANSKVGFNDKAYFISPDYLFYSKDKSLFVQEFDPDDYNFKGEPKIILNNINDFDVADNIIVVSTGAGNSYSDLILYNRNGKVLKERKNLGLLIEMSLSPDQKKLAYHRVYGPGNEESSNQDIWILDREREFNTRFTTEPASDIVPLWSPDGSKIVYASSPDSVYNIYEKKLTGDGTPKLLFKNDYVVKAPFVWSANGKYILLGVQSSGTGYDIWALPTSGNSKPFPYLYSKFDEHPGGFSPDGKWVVYSSDETGRSEIYLQRFPKPEQKLVVSTNGGSLPEWSKNGKEIFYISTDDYLTSVEIAPGSPPAIGTTSKLFKTGQLYFLKMYSVLDNGNKFLVNKILFDDTLKSSIVILNWKSMISE